MVNSNWKFWAMLGRSCIFITFWDVCRWMHKSYKSAWRRAGKGLNHQWRGERWDIKELRLDSSSDHEMITTTCSLLHLDYVDPAICADRNVAKETEWTDALLYKLAVVFKCYLSPIKVFVIFFKTRPSCWRLPHAETGGLVSVLMLHLLEFTKKIYQCNDSKEEIRKHQKHTVLNTDNDKLTNSQEF